MFCFNLKREKAGNAVNCYKKNPSIFKSLAISSKYIYDFSLATARLSNTVWFILPCPLLVNKTERKT